jgi:hypothetical protein
VSEPDLLEKWRFGDQGQVEDVQGYQKRFDSLFAEIYGLPSCSLKNYFDEVQVQYVPRYSYGEESAALHERGTRLSISRSFATFADILAKEQSPWSMPAVTQGGAELLSDATPTMVKVQAAKEYLAEDRFKLKLHDLVTQEISGVLRETSCIGLADPLSGSRSSIAYTHTKRQRRTCCFCRRSSGTGGKLAIGDYSRWRPRIFATKFHFRVV